MSTYPKIQLSKGREISTKRKHPWIFSGGVSSIPDELVNGDVALVESFKGEVLGTCHFHKSSIMCRMLAFEEVEIDAGFFVDRFNDALRYRKKSIRYSEQIN